MAVQAVKLGANGLALLKHFEQCRLTAYQDEAGVWTIGWGHTGPEVHEGLVWTQQQADDQLQKDTWGSVLAVAKSLDVAVSQNAFDALVCFTFNVGADAEGHSTLLKLVNARYTGAASAEFGKWVHSGGHVSNGLVKRREAERALFLTPDDQQAPSLPI